MKKPSNNQKTVMLDPNSLEIGNSIKQNTFDRLDQNRGYKPPPVVILKDNDGTLYVAEGANRAAHALLNNNLVEGLIVNDDFKVGPQTALDRVLGIFFRKKEG